MHFWGTREIRIIDFEALGFDALDIWGIRFKSIYSITKYLFLYTMEDNPVNRQM